MSFYIKNPIQNIKLLPKECAIIRSLLHGKCMISSPIALIRLKERKVLKKDVIRQDLTLIAGVMNILRLVKIYAKYVKNINRIIRLFPLYPEMKYKISVVIWYEEV